KAFAAEELVEQQLAVVRLAVIDVEVQRPARGEHAPHLAQPRLQEAEVVVEAVAVRRLLEQAAAVAPPAEAGSVAVRVDRGLNGPAPLRAAGVERRIEIGEPENAVGEALQRLQAVA